MESSNEKDSLGNLSNCLSPSRSDLISDLLGQISTSMIANKNQQDENSKKKAPESRRSISNLTIDQLRKSECNRSLSYKPVKSAREEVTRSSTTLACYSPNYLSKTTKFVDIRAFCQHTNGAPKYASRGFKVTGCVRLAEKGGGFSDTDGTLEEMFKNQLKLALLRNNASKQVQIGNETNTFEAMRRVWLEMEESLQVNNSHMHLILQAAYHAKILLDQHLVGDRMLLDHTLPDNKFRVSGQVDYLSRGTDRLNQQHENVVQFAMSGNQHVPANAVLQLFITAVLFSRPNAHLVVFHTRPQPALAMYEFKFKTEKLRDYLRLPTLSALQENFYKNTYSHGECKIVFSLSA